MGCNLAAPASLAIARMKPPALCAFTLCPVPFLDPATHNCTTLQLRCLLTHMHMLMSNFNFTALAAATKRNLPCSLLSCVSARVEQQAPDKGHLHLILCWALLLPCPSAALPLCCPALPLCCPALPLCCPALPLCCPALPFCCTALSGSPSQQDDTARKLHSC